MQQGDSMSFVMHPTEPFAAVIYLQSVYDYNNCVKTVLTASKTRVAPVKKRDCICKKGLIRAIIII